jgi:hypothetical protein
MRLLCHLPREGEEGRYVRRFYLSAAALFLLIVPSGAAIHAQEHDIRLSRPSKIGDKYRLSANGEDISKSVVLIGNAPVQQQAENISVDLAASLAVLEINSRGEIRKFALNIEKCLVHAGGVSKPIFPPGSVVVGVTEGPKTVFTMNGAPLEPAAAKALDIVASYAASDVNDDDIFGTGDRKRVGDSWDINAEMAAKGFKQMLNLTTNKEDFKGASTLDAVVKGGNEDYLVISAWLAVDKLSLPLPDGIMIQNGQLKAEFSGRFPANLLRQSPSQSMKLVAWFVGKRAADEKAPEMTIQGVMERRINRAIQHLE